MSSSTLDPDSPQNSRDEPISVPLVASATRIEEETAEGCSNSVKKRYATEQSFRLFGKVTPLIMNIVRTCDDNSFVGIVVATPIFISFLLPIFSIAPLVYETSITSFIVFICGLEDVILGLLLALLLKLSISAIRRIRDLLLKELPKLIKQAMERFSTFSNNPMSIPLSGIAFSGLALVGAYYAGCLLIFGRSVREEEFKRMQYTTTTIVDPPSQYGWSLFGFFVHFVLSGIRGSLRISTALLMIIPKSIRVAKFIFEMAGELVGQGIRKTLRKLPGLWPILCMCLVGYCVFLHRKMEDIARRKAERGGVPFDEERTPLIARS